MRFSLLTRSLSTDYVFVGRRGVDRWWNRGDFQRLYSEEQPSIAVRRDGSGWQLLIAGIPSDRKDTHQRRIRFSILAESDGRDDGEELDHLLGFIHAWLRASSAADRTGGRISVGLSSAFGSEEIERWFEGGDSSKAVTDDKDLANDVSDKIHSVVTSSEAHHPHVNDVGFEQWVGGLASVEARDAFFARVESILRSGASTRRTAFVASLFSDRQDLREQLEKLPDFRSGQFAILIDDDGEVEEIRPKEPSSGAPSTSRKDGLESPRQRNFLLFPLIAAAVLFLLYLWKKS